MRSDAHFLSAFLCNEAGHLRENLNGRQSCSITTVFRASDIFDLCVCTAVLSIGNRPTEAQLEIQQRIEALESALAGQQKTLVKLGLVDSKPESSAAVEHSATYRETPTYEVESQNNAAPS
jgi:hypothetical protein